MSNKKAPSYPIKEIGYISDKMKQKYEEIVKRNKQKKSK